MVETLVSWDHSLFLMINHVWTHPVLDWFFSNWTDLHKLPVFKFFLLPIILGCVFWKLRWRGLCFLPFVTIAVGISDGLCGKVLKFYFERARPPVAGLDAIMRAPHYGGYSFPSNHAANMFCFAVFVTFYFPQLRWPLFLMAFLTAYSRPYTGVHFPSDVVGGALIGGLIGWACALALQPLWKKVELRLSRKEGEHV
ncbi:MAG: phosphatase PAP2 family protein [Bdellovibrio sp.]|jgi:undecaprenyl-diphosphatase